MVRRRRRDFVVDGPQELVAADHLQAGGVGILQIVHDPQPAAGVPLDRERLADFRFTNG